MTNPNVLVNSQSTENGVSVDDDSTVNIALIDTAGVSTWSLDLFSASDGVDIQEIRDSIVITPLTKTATFAIPNLSGIGTTLLFRSTVNNGKNANGVIVPEYTCTFGVYVESANGMRLIAPGESYELSSSYGWTKSMNAMARAAAGDPVVFSGDLSGDYTSQVVEKINGAIVPFANDALTTGNVLKVSDYNTLTYGAITLSNANSVTGNLSINNIANGSENWILTGSSGSNPIWNNSIKSMLNVSSRQFDVVDAIYPTQSLARTQCYSVTTSNTTPSSVTSITLSASTGISLTVNATISDGYTTYGGTNRITNIIKTGLFYRGSSGGAVRSEYSTDTYIHSAVNALHAYEINFSVSGNNVVVSRTGESRNSKWTIIVSYNLVSL